MEECADAGQTNCLAPTTFTYQSGSAGVSGSSSSVNLGSPTNWFFAGYDLNGDGYKDLLYQVGTTWYVAFGSASGYGAAINTGITTPAYVVGRATVLIGNLLGSGKDGLLADNGGTWYYYTWNGSSFSGASTGVPFDTSATAFALADTNGDGLPDLVSLNLKVGSAAAVVYIRLNSSSGGTVSFGGANAAYTNTDNPGYSVTGGMLLTSDVQHAIPVRRLDFNGDGRDDLALQINWYDSGDKIHIPEQFQLLSEGTTFSAQRAAANATTSYYLNWNDDSCTDYINGSKLFLSACNGTPGSTTSLGEVPVGVIDWDGSGRESFLYNSGGYLYVQPSTGNGLGTPFSTSIAFNSTASYMGGDINGDGLDDLLTWLPNSGTLTYNLHNQGGQTPDLLSAVTDGYGNSAKPAYVSMVQSVNSSYFEWNDAQYPYENYLGPLYLVSQTTFSDPSNPPSGTYQQKDYYSGAWTNLQGRGFSGFGSKQVDDSRNGIWETFGYGRAFPYTGMLNGNVATQNNMPSETIFDGSYTLADLTLDGTQYNERYFPYASSSTEKRHEVGGTENGALITTTTASYSYDDYGNVISASRTITDNDSGSPYVGDSWTTSITNTPDVDTGQWCLSLLSESQISYSASNGSQPVTRTREYTPDTTSCRYTQITTEPSSSTYKVTEALGYDSFGNVNSDTITGVGMAARQTTANWGATGQFPVSITDPTNATTQFNYNFSYGLVSSETDPNGLTTSWQYGDGFGRLTWETRPDGTYTTYAYDDCANLDGCPLANHTLAITHYYYNTDGSTETDGTVYYDQVGRPIVWDDMMLSGTQWNRRDVRYDSLGRMVRQAAPCVWSAVTTPCPYWTTMSYDALNRLTQVQRPISQSDSTLQTTSYAYAGRTTTITNPYGHTRTLIRDVNGWLRQSKDALGYALVMGYDAAGAKTSVQDNLGNTLWTGTYAYGIAPFMIGETDVDRGAWGYTVDALGERTGWTDAKGQHFYESYDPLSRPLTRTEPDLFTQWTWGSSAASHNIGKLQSVCTGSGSSCSASYYSESEAYDSLGRPYQRAITIPGMGTYTYTWQYNATTGFLDTLTYPVSTSSNALELKYAYQSGLLLSITDILDSPNVTIWQANSEDPAGHITQETLGNGLVTSRAFDAVTHWLQSVQSGPGGGSSAQNQSFLYDEVGNVTQRQDNNLGLSENFYYDNDNRLSYSTLNGVQNLSLNYNTMGNITSRSDLAGGATWTYDPVHLHEVTQAGSSAYKYVYDANGNATSRQGSSIIWSSYNYPTSISDAGTSETVSFSYGPDRSAWSEATYTQSGAETAYHVGGLLDVVTSGGVTDYRHYIYAGSEPVAIDSRKTNGSNALYYLLTDHQGSVVAITSGTGAAVVGESFTAYGNRRNPTTWSGAASTSDLNTIAGITRHGYTFQSALASQMGLNDMVGRVQDAVTGRFLSADPTDPDFTDPQGFNRYSYVDNNPLTYVDPTGFEPELGEVAVTATREGTDSGGFSGFSSGTADSTGPSPADLGDIRTESRINAHLAALAGKGGVKPTGPVNPTNSTPSQPAQQSNPSQLQPVIVTATYEAPPLQTVVATSTYWDRYANFVSEYAIDVGPYAVGLLGGLWPKSLVPFTGGRPPLLGSTNPLTSVPRALEVPGADSVIVRTGAAGIGVATVGIGFYDATIEVEGFWYAYKGN